MVRPAVGGYNCLLLIVDVKLIWCREASLVSFACLFVLLFLTLINLRSEFSRFWFGCGLGDDNEMIVILSVFIAFSIP
jgi:hypothetical protein